MDGEIDLKSCVKVSEFDVEKNYGFQIQVNISVITSSLSRDCYSSFCLRSPHPRCPPPPSVSST